MKVNRRSFLKGVGATSATCAFSSFVPGSIASLQAAEIKGIGAQIPSICEMCSTRCPISATVTNGKNVFIEGNAKAKSFGGKVCARGGAGHSMLYDPKRLTKPLKRVGERGEGKWEEISWDDAYTFIAKKLNAIKEKHGAEAVAFSGKSGSLTSHLFHLAKAFGSPNTFTHVSTCPGGVEIAALSVLGTNKITFDYSNAKYIVNFGHNIYEGINMSITRAQMRATSEKGAKLVVFEPRFSIVADKADVWYPIKPGTDIAIALALANVLISENLYDKDFIAKHVEGFDEFKESVKDNTPEWAANITDIAAADIRQVALDLAKNAPTAFVDVGHRSTFTSEEFNLRRALIAVNVLLGNVQKKGGLYYAVKAKTYNKLAGENIAPDLAKPGVKDMPKITAKRIDAYDEQYYMAIKLGGGLVQTILEAIVNKKPYQIHAWLMNHTNPMQSVTDRALIQKALMQLELVVISDLYISETAAYADIILPDCTYLERDEEIRDKSSKNPAYYVRQRVVESIGNTKPSWLIYKELGAKMGLDKYFPWKDIETLRYMQVNEDKSLLDTIKKDGYVSYGVPILLREASMVKKFKETHSKAPTPDADGTYASLMKFKTPSGKIELTSADVEKHAKGYGTIKYNEVQLKKDGEFFFIQGKTAIHTNAATQFVPMLNAIEHNNPVWINTETAKKLGIKSGDHIKVTSSVGHEIGVALVTEGIRPDTVFAYVGFGSKNQEAHRNVNDEIHCSNLLPDRTAPVCGMNIHTTGVRVEKHNGSKA